MLHLDHVSKAYGNRAQVLHDVSLRLGEGEGVGVIGESGAGKTTIARIVLGLTAPSSGRYLWKGADVHAMTSGERRKWRRSVQAVFQNPLGSLNPRLRVATLVTEPIEADARLRRQDRAREAGRLLEAVGLPPALASRFPHQLSGGQRQRVAIARALSTEPDLIVLDEPVSALDVSVRAQVLNLLRETARRRTVAFVYITHDVATVGSLCERAVVLHRGRVVETCSTRQLLLAPTHPYTRALLSSVPRLGVRLGEHDAAVPAPAAGDLVPGRAPAP